MVVLYKHIDECNSGKRQKVKIVFDDMNADMTSNDKLNPIVTELFIIRGRKLNISFFYYFLYPTNCFIMKIPKKRRFQRTTINYFSDIYFEEFTSYFKKCFEKGILC